MGALETHAIVLLQICSRLHEDSKWLDGWMNTCSRHLDLLVHDGLYTDQLSRLLVYHEQLAGLENMLS